MWSAGETIWARSEFRWRAGWALEWVERDGCIEAKLYGLFRELSDRKRAREPVNERGSCGYQGNTWRITTSVFFSFFSLHFQQLGTLHSQMRITFSSCTTVPSRYFKNSEKRTKRLTIQDQLCLFLSWWNKGTTTFMSKNLLSCFAIQENVELVMSIRIRSLFTQH